MQKSIIRNIKKKESEKSIKWIKENPEKVKGYKQKKQYKEKSKKYCKERRRKYIEEGRCVDCGIKLKIPFQDHHLLKRIKERNINYQCCERCTKLRKIRYKNREGKFKCIDCGKKKKSKTKRCWDCHIKKRRLDSYNKLK
ncbi:hypothetical protein KY343_03705 [Candidatus Woesearchaeota archaeon]|nr:hypothetical protein [Candidatus Woesearchaeota archaeon]